ncbi:ead/Ea22-like family protein [Salmonella enterica subsp. enterica serovar Saintpaul]|nr:ead/Ea22-like family protein [Salmonella enterica]EBS3744542.1 ead/Ea22-like family protein [Salmonella enterica subsp. enterica serovar Saintpaul]ECY4646768.1 ead/Ea22-like family protein [Salmonella enterica subsp. enterica serovar Eastbourne]EBX0753728.1 ead/Ea22-like family protein [Salmonella enterica subsp. enterica serovar Saintpaul]ECB0582169.1 ead/Ea22-like family protein [Salmonella enterica subsp. enterica serovar Saintpaul]
MKDKQALREVAEKATKGPWKVFSDIDTKTFAIHTPRDKRCENVIKWGGFDCQPNAEANAEFIAAFNPKVALALLDELDELEHYKSREERVTKLVLDNSTSWDVLYKKLEAAERRIAELEKGHQEAAKQINSWRRLAKQNIAERGKDISELEAARQRIAELEARTVNLPKRSVGEVMCLSGFSLDYAEGWCAGNDNAIHEIRAADIGVKGE